MTPDKKRLIVCCDGTWQTLDNVYPTNVVKIAQAIKPISEDGTQQILYYDSGIGTLRGDRIRGGAFGRGIDEKILQAYRFLCLNYCPDVDEIYLFGFSRGAYTVRSLAGMMSYCGLLPRQQIRSSRKAYDLYRERNNVEFKDQEASTKNSNNEKIRDFWQTHGSQTVKITLLGCWDTVGALGIPNFVDLPEVIRFLDLSERNQKKYEFLDTSLSKFVQHALHAVAVDEHRKVFQVTPMTPNPTIPDQVQEMWFAGEHGCVGGGTQGHRGLSDCTLQWMINRIRSLGIGLEFDESRVQYSADNESLKLGIYPDPEVPFLNGGPTKFGFRGNHLREINNQKDLSEYLKIRWKSEKVDYKPENLAAFKGYLDSWGQDEASKVDAFEATDDEIDGCGITIEEKDAIPDEDLPNADGGVE
ncbi:DUF2235 domain-containing protein [Romeria aff. gracilis LEGE 07310]|uniref:DUF2235 domain-containing protein n=1 Tax=Vasconcelosia minhoensis LEGE 07310 TaxID=915328 RepID=A0A8J7AUB5_9CYAN|nr:DUF2235 domain-containing protein [Romeria gracilis]MBE9076803.1 DUF2235 domain-containing protein [Romeria aff. gracilis LEGE 07310]